MRRVRRKLYIRLEPDLPEEDVDKPCCRTYRMVSLPRVELKAGADTQSSLAREHHNPQGSVESKVTDTTQE